MISKNYFYCIYHKLRAAEAYAAQIPLQLYFTQSKAARYNATLRELSIVANKRVW